jgi:hypothetical protein
MLRAVFRVQDQQHFVCNAVIGDADGPAIEKE